MRDTVEEGRIGDGMERAVGGLACGRRKGRDWQAELMDRSIDGRRRMAGRSIERGNGAGLADQIGIGPWQADDWSRN